MKYKEVKNQISWSLHIICGLHFIFTENFAEILFGTLTWWQNCFSWTTLVHHNLKVKTLYHNISAYLDKHFRSLQHFFFHFEKIDFQIYTIWSHVWSSFSIITAKTSEHNDTTNLWMLWSQIAKDCIKCLRFLFRW